MPFGTLLVQTSTGSFDCVGLPQSGRPTSPRMTVSGEPEWEQRWLSVASATTDEIATLLDGGEAWPFVGRLETRRRFGTGMTLCVGPETNFGSDCWLERSKVVGSGCRWTQQLQGWI